MTKENRMSKTANLTLILVLLLALACSMLAACGGQGKGQATDKETATDTPAGQKEDKQQTTSQTDLVEGNFTIGISQFAQHGSLDNCREGFLSGLAESGFVEGENLTVDYQNAGAEMAIASQIAENFVSKKYDLIMAVATPSAMHAFNAAMGSGIPVVYTAVTDPVKADLAKEDGSSAGDITGTSDILPVEAQLKMIREMMPEAKKIGILYTTSEANSESSIAIYEDLAPKYGFELVTSGIANSSDIPLAVDNILKKVDCLSNLTDNTVVNSLPTILDKAFSANIPVFGSEIEQVALGCLASEGLDYIELGRQTGVMAAKVLKGETTAAEMKFETFQGESLLCLNLEAAQKLGIESPDAMLERGTTKFEKIEAAR